MYKVTFARHHPVYMRFNRENEGSFTLTFNKLSQIAHYMFNRQDRIHYVCSNLTWNEKILLKRKLNSLYQKRVA